MSRRSIIARRLVPCIGLVALVVAGCGNDDDSAPVHHSSTTPAVSTSAATGTAQAGTFNDADVTFLQMMYPHHEQAVQMAELVPSRSQDQQVIDLAAGIKAAQQPEMTQIQSLLASAGKPDPAGGAMNHDMPGMMSPEQMSSLEAMSGPEFDKMWLQMMIDHHRGAVEMAQSEIASGTNSQAKQIAETIVATQQQEITQMETLLGQK
ncbi:DUF305 domain-containing protein [Nocardia farcinica]|uniref:DUF305 domain-containing protein n=1 Tax=Nocardia farcinica TaxID=37329 RepID=UPI001893159F|nr:DUF305 domain-containing protein [Nocardia farcinica]MBF6259764.1 DUF305 domain-containing protein [Nocardia farcinica]